MLSMVPLPIEDGEDWERSNDAEHPESSPSSAWGGGPPGDSPVVEGPPPSRALLRRHHAGVSSPSFAIFSRHTSGASVWTFWPSESTATVTGKFSTSNS